MRRLSAVSTSIFFPLVDNHQVFDRWFKWHQLNDQPCLGGDAHLAGDFVFQLEEEQE